MQINVKHLSRSLAGSLVCVCARSLSHLVNHAYGQAHINAYTYATHAQMCIHAVFTDRRLLPCTHVSIRQHTPAYVSIRMLTDDLGALFHANTFYCTSITFLILPLSCASGVATFGMQSASVTTKKECTADAGGGRSAAGRGHAFFLCFFHTSALHADSCTRIPLYS